MQLEFSRQIFKKSPHVSNFLENPSSGNRADPCGWTDRHDEAQNAFHNFANAPKNYEADIQLTTIPNTTVQQCSNNLSMLKSYFSSTSGKRARIQAIDCRQII